MALWDVYLRAESLPHRAGICSDLVGVRKQLSKVAERLFHPAGRL